MLASWRSAARAVRRPRPLLERGFTVVCVELGEQLAERARHNLSGWPVEVQVAPFECWDGEEAAFDLVYAATAWHWLDPAIRYEKAHRHLRPGGCLAFWGASHAFPADFDPFFSDIQAVYEEIGESRPGNGRRHRPSKCRISQPEIEASDLFDEAHVRRYLWSAPTPRTSTSRFWSTFSGHIAMAESKRQHLFAEIRRRRSAAWTPNPTALARDPARGSGKD